MSTRTQPFPFADFERARASVESALTKDDDLYMMLVGDTGVGKTALLRQLHRTLDRCRFRVIYFAHARRLTAPGLIRVLSGQFRLHPKRSHPETVLDLSRHMAEEPAQLLVWFDEAHALPEDTFDEARTFAESNLDGSRPVRLLLSGLPDLRERLMASPALWRRVTLREEITGITADSRAVGPGMLFAAIPGTVHDGRRFIAAAADAGAVAVLAPRGTVVPSGLALVEADEPRGALARMAGRFYPRRPDVIAAVTGTNGKSSVVSFTRQIWMRLGLSAACLGTLGYEGPGDLSAPALTTADPVALHRLLDQAARAGVGHLALEASSHGLDQHRLDGVRLAAAGFTNLGRDHMDYHPTVEDYHRAKLRLFDTLLPKGAPAVIFADDVWSKPTIKAAEAAGLNVLTVGRQGAFLKLKRVEHERYRQRAEIAHAVAAGS